MRRWVALALVAGCLRGVPDHLPEHVPQPPPPVPPAPVEAPLVGPPGPGPLSRRVSAQDQQDHQLASIRDSRRPMTLAEIAEEGKLVADLADIYATPAIGDKVRRGLAQITRPEMVDGFYDGLDIPLEDSSIYRRLGGVSASVWRVLSPPPATGATHEWFAPSPGVVELAVRDLTTPWQLDLSRLHDAKALVLDLSAARGSDPRALIPLVEQLTGRAPLAPLRAIDRPADADGYVAAYAARYATETRDRAVWDALVGTMPAATAHRTLPIEIVVGHGCEAACELATRVLATYADAKVYGAIGDAGRLAHDEPARAVLPHSRIQVVFFATTYRLNPEIERADADLWNRRWPDGGDDVAAFAAREAEYRLRGGWPRCDAQPWVATPELLPPALRAKLDRADDWTKCKGNVEVDVTAHASVTAVNDLVTSCGLSDLTSSRVTGGIFRLARSSAIPFGVIAQLAASPLVERVRVSCSYRFDKIVLE